MDEPGGGSLPDCAPGSLHDSCRKATNARGNRSLGSESPRRAAEDQARQGAEAAPGRSSAGCCARTIAGSAAPAASCRSTGHTGGPAGGPAPRLTPAEMPPHHQAVPMEPRNTTGATSETWCEAQTLLFPEVPGLCPYLGCWAGRVPVPIALAQVNTPQDPERTRRPQARTPCPSLPSPCLLCG